MPYLNKKSGAKVLRYSQYCCIRFPWVLIKELPKGIYVKFIVNVDQHSEYWIIYNENTMTKWPRRSCIDTRKQLTGCTERLKLWDLNNVVLKLFMACLLNKIYLLIDIYCKYVFYILKLWATFEDYKRLFNNKLWWNTFILHLVSYKL